MEVHSRGVYVTDEKLTMYEYNASIAAIFGNMNNRAVASRPLIGSSGFEMKESLTSPMKSARSRAQRTMQIANMRSRATKVTSEDLCHPLRLPNAPISTPLPVNPKSIQQNKCGFQHQSTVNREQNSLVRDSDECLDQVEANGPQRLDLVWCH